jgi:hypothetical protein
MYIIIRRNDGGCMFFVNRWPHLFRTFSQTRETTTILILLCVLFGAQCGLLHLFCGAVAAHHAQRPLHVMPICPFLMAQVTGETLPATWKAKPPGHNNCSQCSSNMLIVVVLLLLLFLLLLS